MAQIFSSAADAWLRLFVVGALALVTGGLTAAVGFARSDYYTGVNIHPANQPVPFSHRHHVGGLGIDCRYCHTEVEQSARAGLPPTHTCMTCHSQVWTGAPILAPVRHSLGNDKALRWNRVARLPDYVYFRHDIHIAKGVGCVECHGRIDTMALTYKAKPLTMQFCIDCHRDPAPHLRPLAQVTNMRWHRDASTPSGHEMLKEYGIRTDSLTHCTVCHR